MYDFLLAFIFKEVKILDKEALILAVVIFCIALCYSNSFAMITDGSNVKEIYEGATVACTACHIAGNFKELNSYGKAYNDAGRSVEAVQMISENDSDSDGVNNADEIKSGTNPGDATDK